MVNQIFINLPVKDLESTKKFWITCGFAFNSQFTDQHAASLILGENIFAMLLIPSFYSTFTKKQLADTSTTNEVINAFSVSSREEVDQLIEKVLLAGGTLTRPTDDYGWMYSKAFQDIDGHLWEVVYMDMTKVPQKPGESNNVTT